MAQNSFSYLALGDSYTIGEAVDVNDRWPMQLVNRIGKSGVRVEKPRIIATTGWTTDELQASVNESQFPKKYDLVSLLIGVNNQYRGYNIEKYKVEFKSLLEKAIELSNGNSTNVFVLSIPDYGVTQFSAEHDLDPTKIAIELEEYNRLASEISESLGVQFFSITEWSKRAKDDKSLIASDKLHPSGIMYTNWVDTCFDWVLKNLQSR